MFCIKCFSSTTQVKNSRPHKKDPLVWRRRYCPSCKTTFTTRESPSLSDNKTVYSAEGETEVFNLGRLIISISKAFTHSKKDARYSTLWLARSIETTLSHQREVITPDDITATTHATLKRFDELAAVQYAAQHGLISAVRRRGRPSLA